MQHFHVLWLLKPLQSDKYMGHISLFLVVKMKDKFPSRRLFHPKFSQRRNIKCLTEERRKNCQKKQFGLIHFFVLCLKSIPFLYFSWDHLPSTMGIICGPRSFPVHFGDHLQSEDHLRLGIIYDTLQISCHK